MTRSADIPFAQLIATYNLNQSDIERLLTDIQLLSDVRYYSLEPEILDGQVYLKTEDGRCNKITYVRNNAPEPEWEMFTGTESFVIPSLSLIP